MKKLVAAFLLSVIFSNSAICFAKETQALYLTRNISKTEMSTLIEDLINSQNYQLVKKNSDNTRYLVKPVKKGQPISEDITVLLKQYGGDTYLYYQANSKCNFVKSKFGKALKQNNHSIYSFEDPIFKAIFVEQANTFKDGSLISAKDYSNIVDVKYDKEEFNTILSQRLIGRSYLITNKTPDTIHIQDLKWFNTFDKKAASKEAERLLNKQAVLAGAALGVIGGAIVGVKHLKCNKEVDKFLSGNRPITEIKPNETVQVKVITIRDNHPLGIPFFKMTIVNESNKNYYVTNEPKELN